MIDSIIERTEIHWADFDTRFSTEPRTLPISGPPATPPPDPKPVNRRTPEYHPILRAKREPTQRANRGSSPSARGHRGRPRLAISPIATSPCAKDNGLHVWGLHSELQVICVKCRRRVRRRLIPDLVVLPRAERKALKEAV